MRENSKMEKSNKLFENETTYTQNMYIDFVNFHNKRYNFSYILYTIIWFIILFSCIVYCFSCNMRLQGVVITIILLSFIIYRFVRPKMLVNKELKSDKVGKNNINVFTFYPKHMEIKNKNGKFTYNYFMIRRAFETKENFYLYVTKENAFLISKKTFSLGTAEEFSKFAKSKFGLRYKFYKD